jgi:hypothetical protein
VAGLAPNEFMRPEGTLDFRRPVRTVLFLGPAPGTLCQANFQRRSATAEMLSRVYGKTFPAGASGTACRGAGELGECFPGVSLPGRSTPGYSLPTLRVGEAEQPGGLPESSRRSQLAKTSGIHAQNFPAPRQVVPESERSS